MKFNIRGSKVKVTDPIKSYIEEKIGKLDKYLTDPDNLTASVVIRIRGIEQIIKITIPTKRIILRGEAGDKDLYAAIDIVAEKIESQIRKNKTRMNHKKIREHFEDFIVNLKVKKEDLVEKEIVKRKEIELKPMSEEEAILQMNLLKHDFFVFKHETEANICVLYRRQDGNYGLIQTNQD